MTVAELKISFNQATTFFAQADADSRLAILNHVYNNLREAITSPAPTALHSQVVNHLIRQLHQVRREDRLEVLRDMLNGAETRFGREYSTLNINMRLAFWYRLAEESDLALATTARSHRDGTAFRTLARLVDEMDLNQQIHFLRQVLSAEPVPQV